MVTETTSTLPSWIHIWRIRTTIRYSKEPQNKTNKEESIDLQKNIKVIIYILDGGRKYKHIRKKHRK